MGMTPEKVLKWLESKPKCWFWDGDPSEAKEGLLECVSTCDEYPYMCGGDWYINCSLENPFKYKETTPINAAIKLNKEGPFECEVSNNRKDWHKAEIIAVHVGDCPCPFETESAVHVYCRIEE